MQIRWVQAPSRRARQDDGWVLSNQSYIRALMLERTREAMRVHSRKQTAHLVVILTILAIVLHLAWPQPARAQAVGATLSGVVTDSSGAAIANATISIKNQGTGEVRQQTTNSDGIYSAPNLIPGLYEVSVTASGFKKLVQAAITLNVGAQRELNLSLKPGQTTEVVEVTDIPPDVETTTSAVTSTVDS